VTERERGSGRAGPTAGRPRLPAGYGVPATEVGLLPWAWAEERLAGARHYWVGTAGPAGRPHAVPVWGVWHDGALYVGGHPATRTARNLAANPRVAVHVERGDDIVIVEGGAEPVTDAPLLRRLAAAGAAKYFGGADAAEADAGAGGGDAHVTYALRPRVAFGWGAGFPADMTRWRFAGT
jgi:hypothetical protein